MNTLTSNELAKEAKEMARLLRDAVLDRPDAVMFLRRQAAALIENLSGNETIPAHDANHVEQAATILAIALACDDYKPQHTEWKRLAAQWLNVPRGTPETGAQSGVLEVGLTADETMVVMNHPQIDQDERGGHILFTADQARNLGELLLKKAGECRAQQLVNPTAGIDP